MMMPGLTLQARHFLSGEHPMFKTNEGTLDRALRVIAGLALIAIVFVGPQTPWGWIGLVPLATGLIGWCPVYTLLGIRTCPVKKA
jgi:hypothetical protein